MNKALLHDPAERQRRIDRKRKLLLSWLVDFTWTTPDIAGSVMGLKARSATYKTLRQLSDKGLLRCTKVKLFAGREITIYGITQDGLFWADSENDTRFQKPAFNPARVSVTTFQHRIDVQRCRLKVDERNDLIWLSENNLPKNLLYRPDAIVTINNWSVALELERTVKTRKRYQQIIVQHLQQIKFKNYDIVHYVSPQRDFSNRLQRLLFSIPTLNVKGQKIHFRDDLKKYFKFSSIEDWRL